MEQNLIFEDRRTFARFPAKLHVEYCDTNSVRDGQAETYDLCAKGLSFLNNEKLSPQTAVDIRLYVHDNGQPLSVKGEVVWSKRVKYNKYRIGIKLAEPDLMGISRVLRIH